jgi:NAD(P)H-hydrate repair Nnr-like enzyme with NAD(P)H-hydrate dehydratase domain
MSNPVMIDADLLRRFPLPRVPEDSGKEERGRLLVIAGSRELAGAASSRSVPPRA